jgi:endoglycosylceramidase
MARRLAVLAALVLVCSAAPAAATPSLPLGHAGRWLTDSRGRVVVLHGVNMVYKQPPYAPSVTGFGADDAAFLAENGFNTVRVGVIYAAVEPAPGVYDDAYLDSIGSTVRTLAGHGIVSMLDFHQDMFNERFQGEGWPDWAVQDDGLPAQPQLGFPGNYLAMPALWRAFDHFWANDPGPAGIGLQERYAAAWRHVAERFRDDAAVLGYELLNEPWPGTQWPTCANPVGCPVFDAELAAFTRRTLRSIRAADARTLVWYEPNVIFNNGAQTQIGDPGDARSGFAFHDYCLIEPQTRSNAGCDPFDDLVFQNAEQQSRRTGDALLLTEFGATDDADNLEATVDRADRNRVGWQYWAYCGCEDPTTSGPGATQALVIDPSKPPAGDNVKAAKLAILARPYPQVVSGTPRSWSFDSRTRVFRLAYSTARAGGGAFRPGSRTEVFLPALQYPRGYTVEASGAHVVSPPGARRLVLASLPGTAGVSVTVKPAGGGSDPPPVTPP